MKIKSAGSILALASLSVIVLAGCGGSSNNNSSTASTTPPAPDAFLSQVITIAATSPENTEPASIDAIVSTSPENIEPSTII